MRRLAKKLVQAALRLINQAEVQHVHKLVDDFFRQHSIYVSLPTTRLAPAVYYDENVRDITLSFSRSEDMTDDLLDDLKELLRQHYTLDKVDIDQHWVEIFLSGSNRSSIKEKANVVLDIVEQHFPDLFYNHRFDEKHLVLLYHQNREDEVLDACKMLRETYDIYTKIVDNELIVYL